MAAPSRVRRRAYSLLLDLCTPWVPLSAQNARVVRPEPALAAELPQTRDTLFSDIFDAFVVQQPRSGGSGVLHTSCGRAAVIAVRRGAVSATASVAKWVASPFLNSELTAHTLYNLLCS